MNSSSKRIAIPYNLDALPGVLGELVRAGLANSALALLKERGGALVYIPKTEDGLPGLAHVIGLDAALFLSKRYGGETIFISTAKRAIATKAMIFKLRDEGRSVCDIAQACGVTVRWVSALVTQANKAKKAAPSDQGELSL